MPLHLPCTLGGLPVGYVLTAEKTDERQVLLDIPASTEFMNQVQADGNCQLLIGDKNYFGADFEETVDQTGIELLLPAREGKKPRAEARFSEPLRQVIESTNDTLKGRLDVERHGGRIPAGVIARFMQRLPAMTTRSGTTMISVLLSAAH